MLQYEFFNSHFWSHLWTIATVSFHLLDQLERGNRDHKRRLLATLFSTTNTDSDSSILSFTVISMADLQCNWLFMPVYCKIGTFHLIPMLCSRANTSNRISFRCLVYFTLKALTSINEGKVFSYLIYITDLIHHWLGYYEFHFEGQIYIYREKRFRLPSFMAGGLSFDNNVQVK